VIGVPLARTSSAGKVSEAGAVAAAGRRRDHQPGSMPSTPTTRPSANAASTIRVIGARHWWPNIRWTAASCWLFSAKANRAKKTAAFSIHFSSRVSLVMSLLGVT